MNWKIPRFVRILFVLFLIFFVLVIGFGLFQVQTLQTEIRERFDGNRWSVPAVVYARPLELYPGLQISSAMLEKELQLAGYRQESKVLHPGGYSRVIGSIHLMSRDFMFESGLEKSSRVQVYFNGGEIDRLVEATSGRELPFLRLDPARIGSFHPLVHEDRIVLQSSEIPELLRQTLMAVEDRNFLSHHGISISGISRAILANLSAGKTVQGGSTLTQQLVKNFFLNRERTIKRKFQEAVMAIILERHYSKDDILTAYVNEVFLGQDGGRAIHGFGLASQFYFRRDLEDLSIAQIATLVGMVKGPSYYDPRRNPENCLARRAVVIDALLRDKVIDITIAASADAEPLTQVAALKNGFNRFPSFLELLRRQLQSEYKEEDLKSSGLKILTTLDPQVQWQVEDQLQTTVKSLQEQRTQKNIEGAVIVTGRENGEVLAIAGSIEPLQGNFNRALDAQRPIGSLIKPAVYLTALARGYTLASPVLDAALAIPLEDSTWRPANYDRVEHGRVPLYQALAHSYNLATIRLGMELGLPEVIATLNALGYPKSVAPYPSLLLGAISMSPFEVAQFYQTIASGGFYQPLRSIRAVLATDGQLLNRYGLEVQQHFPPEPMYLLTHGLQRVMEEGTGSSAEAVANDSFAGKTGTSDDLRDSWFAGFSGERLAVVWLGRDDNQSVNLTGSNGALKVWAKIMQGLGVTPLPLAEPSTIGWRRIDKQTLQPTHPLNRNSTMLPFVAGSEPGARRGRPVIQFDTRAIEQEAKKILDAVNQILK